MSWFCFKTGVSECIIKLKCCSGLFTQIDSLDKTAYRSLNTMFSSWSKNCLGQDAAAEIKTLITLGIRQEL